MTFKKWCGSMVGATFLDEIENCFEILTKWKVRKVLAQNAHIRTPSTETNGGRMWWTLCRSCQTLRGVTFFQKRGNKQKSSHSVVESRESVCRSWRSAADAEAAEQIHWKNNIINCKFSPNAKTHRRCAADCAELRSFRRGWRALRSSEDSVWKQLSVT